MGMGVRRGGGTGGMVGRRGKDGNGSKERGRGTGGMVGRRWKDGKGSKERRRNRRGTLVEN
jgi:hypothetical protein